jgi:hypothetical protein
VPLRIGTVTTLGLVLGKLLPDFQNDLASLIRVMRDHELSLVDWCQAQQVQAIEDQLATYLKPWSAS